MSSQRPVRIIHRNDLGAYLGDWKNAMQVMYSAITRRNPGEAQRYRIARIPTPIESFSFNSNDFSILLGYLDDKLEILEQTPLVAGQQIDYQAYADARLFLKVFFIFLRILLDDLAAIIEYFYKKNEGIGLPPSFNDLQENAKKRVLPTDLYQLLEPTFLWFPEMRDTRDDLIHHYDSILLSFKQGTDGKSIIGHFNIKGRASRIEEDTRKHVGLLLSEYQRLIDNLLDHFDTKFREWYGIVQGKSGRSMSIIEGGISLWWAYEYGGYRNETLQVIED
jgi:hypothetical protein